MELRWVTTFLAVVDNHGFAAAAQALHCSQPTVSGQVSALEIALGTPLFDRDHRPVRLTPNGETFLPHARAILNEVEAARGSVADLLGARRGTVRLGTYPSATAGYVPELLKGFHEDRPLVRIHLSELGGAELGPAALAGDVELFLRQISPPLSSSVFENRMLWRERFKMVIHPDHPFARESGPVPAEVLLEHPLILTGRYQPDSLSTHGLWHSLGEPPTIAYQVSQPQSLIELVRGGLGLGITTQLALDVSHAEGLIVRDIDHPEAVREVSLYWVKGRRLSSAAAALRDYMLTEGPVPPGTDDARGSVRVRAAEDT